MSLRPSTTSTRGHDTRRRGRLARRAMAAMLVTGAGLYVSSAAGSAAAPLAGGPASLGVSVVNGHRFGITTPIHVLRFSQDDYKIVIDVARHAVDNGVQTPSSMCRTTRGCVAAINGDFFAMTPAGTPDPADAVGGVVRDCVILHTPQVSHQQVDLDAHTVSQGLGWSTVVDANGVNVPIDAINQELPLSYSQVHLALGGTLLYTPAYALKVPSSSGRVTYYFAHVGGSTPPTRINTAARLELVATTTASFKVAPGHVAISAPRSTALSSIAMRGFATMTTVSDAGCDDIGGHPILLDHGVVAPIDPADTFLMRPYARTVLGWTAAGTTVMLTVDGRDGITGATAHQLDALLESLHVVTAIGLDGGNSTTLFAHGRVLNHPSRGKERPVGTGLLVVRK